MRREKHYLYLDEFEYRLAVVGMNNFRNQLIRTGKPTEDVDTLLLKLLKAKPNAAPAETLRSGEHCARSPNPTVAAHSVRQIEKSHINDWRYAKCWN